MKYDLILGNPPFSEKNGSNSSDLDSRFVLKAIDMSDKVVLIIRAKHFRRPQSVFRKELFGSGKVSQLRYVDTRKEFPTISGNTETCIVTVDKNHSGPCRVIFEDGTEKDINLTRDRCIRLGYPDFNGLPAKNNMGYRWMFGDLARHAIVDDPNGISLIEILDKDDDGNIIPVIRKTNQSDAGYNEHGVVMNYNYDHGRLGKLFVKPKDTAISGSVIMLKTESKEESIKLLNYLESDEVRAVIDLNKGWFSNSRYVFDAIEDIK